MTNEEKIKEMCSLELAEFLEQVISGNREIIG